MTTLILVRHGETEWNRARRIQGRTDIPLNDDGRDQARATARRLADEIAPGPVVVISSDLSRAKETAEIIADGLGVGLLRTSPDLRERSYGEAEGIETSEFARRWGDWYSAEVPGAEPRSELRRRALRALRHAVRDARRATAPNAPTVIVVAHGALIREVMLHATTGAFPSLAERLPNGSSHVFLVERERITLQSTTASVPA
ncbi:histidine phosphatase family protein [Microbacterium koreense]|uniref:Histidine phosphatase family protein n=1 Tax=Microbacterium koreense TaxID=323761 RepID=A0ABW2ZSN9_9MICO